jgi:membrane-associated PAP2 superfamily phosphatase
VRRYAPGRGADLIVVAFGGAMLAVWSNRWSGFDLWLSAQFHDATRGGFLLARDGLGSLLLHDGLKWLSVLVWLGLLCAWVVVRVLRPMSGVLRERIAFVLRVSLAATLAVNLARSQSAHSCPWSLTDFGGNAQFFRLFDALPALPGRGHCLPSGHAASAMMWLAVLPVLSERRRVQALIGVLSLGVLAGSIQIMRGAHFLSHVLLTASLCAAVVWLAVWASARED